MPRPPTLTPELLHTFVTLVACDGDASRAAEALGINQPSMSKRLSYFQHPGRLIRRPWVERRGKVWLLTEEGRRVLPVVEDLLRRYEYLLRFVETPVPAGLTLACGQEAAGTFVLAALEELRRRHPDERIRLSTLRGQVRIEGVASGLLDLALVTHDEGQIEALARRPLHVEPLFDDPLVLVTAADAPWAKAFRDLPAGRPLGKALTRFPLILPEPDSGLREQLNSRLRDAGLLRLLNVVLEVGGWGVILAYVRARFGVALLPRSALIDQGGGLLVRDLPPSLTPPNRLRMICRKRASDQRDLSPLGEECWEVLKARAAAIRAAIS